LAHREVGTPQRVADVQGGRLVHRCSPEDHAGPSGQ
jgi:hypothetical protein